MKEYKIHNNGGRPFLVSIHKNIAEIYKIIKYDVNNDGIYSSKPVIKIKFEKCFVGKSPMNEMTKFSGGYGKEFDGNTILLKISSTQQKNKYIYIGPSIYSFYTQDLIKKYVSPVGNNDVPYPYAVDNHNNIYLLEENVIINVGTIKNKDPYRIYYNNIKIRDFYIGTNKYDMKHTPFPSKNYDRMAENIGKNMYIMDDDNKKHVLTKKKYVDIMKKFGNKMNYKKINKKVLQNRI